MTELETAIVTGRGRGIGILAEVTPLGQDREAKGVKSNTEL